MASILFVSPYSFSYVNGGTILFREFFKKALPYSFGWFICSEPYINNKLNYKFKFVEYFDVLFFNNFYINLFARKFVLFGVLFFWIRYNFISKLVSKKLHNVISDKSIDKLWVYASHSSISSLYFLLKTFEIKYHLSIQDDYSTHLPSHESKYLKEKFKFIIENANSIDFISSSMEEYYRSLYEIKVNTTIFYISYQENELELPVLNQTITKIGYAGNIWCGSSFIPLLAAIKELRHQFNCDIKLVIFAQNFPKKLFNDYLDFVEYKGFLSSNELVFELRKCDLLYLPLTFDENLEIVNLTSFPSKIITYLNSGIPILNHSPINSSSNFFVRENEIGYSINSTKINDFVNLFLHDKLQTRNFFSINSKTALKKFNHENMIESLKYVLFNNF